MNVYRALELYWEVDEKQNTYQAVDSGVLYALACGEIKLSQACALIHQIKAAHDQLKSL